MSLKLHKVLAINGEPVALIKRMSAWSCEAPAGHLSQSKHRRRSRAW